MGTFANFYTYIKDINRGTGGMGSPVSYRYDISAFTTDPLGTPSEGEMLAWDATNNRILRFNRTGANGKFIGVNRDDASGFNKLGNQPGLTPSELSIMTSGVHALLGTVGDTYSHGDAVYQNGTDTTRVTKTQGSNGVQVGVVENPLNQSFAGAVRVPILIDTYTVTQK
jgi:hypothetical protein